MMKTFEVDGLILEATSVNEQVRNGDKTTRDFQGSEIAIVRNGQIKKIRPLGGAEDIHTLPDGTWRVTIDEDDDFCDNNSWFIMSNKGITSRNIGFTDGDESISQDRVHKVVGRASNKVEGVEESSEAPASTQENRIVTVGDREFLIVDNKAYQIYK